MSAKRKKKKQVKSHSRFTLNYCYHGPNHSAYNQGPHSNFLFPLGGHLISSEVHSTIHISDAVDEGLVMLVLEQRRGGTHQSAVSCVLILTPVS